MKLSTLHSIGVGNLNRGLPSSIVDVRQGSIEAIPVASDEIDVVFCRDMLNPVKDLDLALGECRRVLKSGGAMVVYQTFATPLLEPEEARRMYADLVMVPERMSIDDFEQRVDAAGFTVEYWTSLVRSGGSHGKKMAGGLGPSNCSMPLG